MQTGKILVVDDEAELRYILAEYLQYKGFGVWQAADGIEALAILNVEKFDLMITDLGMPELNGFGLINKIYSHPNLNPKIILMSALKTSEQKRLKTALVNENKVDGFFEKPFNLDDLLKIVQSL